MRQRVTVIGEFQLQVRGRADEKIGGGVQRSFQKAPKQSDTVDFQIGDRKIGIVGLKRRDEGPEKGSIGGSRDGQPPGFRLLCGKQQRLRCRPQ